VSSFFPICYGRFITCGRGSGAVGFIGWLGPVRFIASIAAKNEFWNASEGDAADHYYGANPFPTGRSKRQKSKTVSKGSNRTENEKRASEVTVDAAASGSVEQTECPHKTQ